MEKWLDKIKSFKKEQILILLLCGVLLLVIALPADAPSTDARQQEETRMNTQETQTPDSGAAEERTRRLENRLKTILSKVEGIGKTEVMLTLKSDGKRMIEKDLEESQGKEENQEENGASASDQSSSRESTVYQRDAQGNELPYVTEELEPEIAGVLVIAQGAGNAAVVSEITEAVMALFGVEAHKIKVMKME